MSGVRMFCSATRVGSSDHLAWVVHRPPQTIDSRSPGPRSTDSRGKPHSPHHYYRHYWLYLSFRGTSGEGRVKFVCLQENLAHGLGIAGRGVSTRGSLPILSHVLLRTDAGRLRLTATNLEVGINCWVPAKVEDEGAITVPAKLFIDFVNSLPPGNVELSLNVRTKTIHLKSGPYEANIKRSEEHTSELQSLRHLVCRLLLEKKKKKKK